MLIIAKNFVYLQVLLVTGWLIFYYSLRPDRRAVIGLYPVSIMSALTVVLFFSPAYAVTSAIIFLFPVAVCRTRNHLLIVMLIGMLATPAFQAQVTAGGLWLFAWSLQSTLGLGGLVALLATRKDHPTDRPAINVSLLLFLVLVILIAARGSAISNWTRMITSFICTYGIPAFVIGICLKSATGRQTLLTTLAGVGSMLGTVLTYESRVHWPMYLSLDQKYGFIGSGTVVKFRAGVMRAYGPMDESTNAGFTLVIMFAAALACGAIFKRGAFRYLVPALIGLGVAAPQSRGALIGAGVVIVAYTFYRFGAAGLGKASMILAPLIAIYFARKTAAGPLANADTESTSDYRSQLLTRGIQEFWHHPIVGDEMGRVYARLEDMRQGEGIIDFVNTYLYFALAAGAIGLAVFCIVLFLPVGQLLGRRRALLNESATGAYAAFVFATLLACGVMLIFTSIQQRPMILMLALAGTAATITMTRTSPRVARQSGSSATQSTPSEA